MQDESNKMPSNADTAVLVAREEAELTEAEKAAQEVYQEELAKAQSEDFSDLDALNFLNHAEGRPLVVLIAKHLPATTVDPDRLKRYIYVRMHELVHAGEYTVVYFHTDASTENSPGVFWLRAFYESLPKSYRDNLRGFYFVHTTLSARVTFWAFSQWLSPGLWKQLVYISRIEFLEDYLGRIKWQFPEFIVEHDKDLERRPLMDYGLEPDPGQVLPGPGIPLVSADGVEALAEQKL